MFSHWPIRRKLQLGLGLFAVSVLTLFGSAHYGLYAYRGLVKSLSARATELPLSNRLSEHVSDLRVTISQARQELSLLPYLNQNPVQEAGNGGGPAGIPPLDAEHGGTGVTAAEQDSASHRSLTWTIVQIDNQFDGFRRTLAAYRDKLDSNSQRTGERIGDYVEEADTLNKIENVLADFEEAIFPESDSEGALPLTQDAALVQLPDEESIEELQRLTAQLPSHLHERLQKLADDVRLQYRVAIVTAWVTTAVATLMVLTSFYLLRRWISQPLDMLVKGSREVAAGKFDHRIRLETDDEMGELADAMNAMTARFCETRDDLDRQVRDRTKQVVRSEQLASVGFLAAGVAHEINNPLASIALCSESLESRLAELLGDDGTSVENEVIRHYLEMIQKEAFRCKQITEKLLDFSRMGDSERHHADLRDLVAGVIDMVCHLGRYQDKQVRLIDGDPVIADVNAQEIKQVMLNLITNGLDSLDPGGTVTVSVQGKSNQAEIIVEDDGCGMTEEVIRHLFEPFFTRRRGGQGTGLGLSITYRIVEEHNGQIVATSDGIDQGSQFTITLPLHPPAGERRSAVAA